MRTVDCGQWVQNVPAYAGPSVTQVSVGHHSDCAIRHELRDSQVQQSHRCVSDKPDSERVDEAMHSYRHALYACLLSAAFSDSPAASPSPAPPSGTPRNTSGPPSALPVLPRA
jgi:hypothetical protein